MSTHEAEIESGERFEFGRNWRNFSRTLTPERVKLSEQAIKDMLGVESLQDKTLLDAGSGSGLSSLAARNLGAKVTSFDYDGESVACTRALKDRYCGNDADWAVDEGSVLDRDYLAKLGTFDIVYSWGVLHHTGAMWEAIENVTALVAPEGRLFIAIYNNEGWKSRVWKRIKQVYCSSAIGKALVSAVFIPYLFLRNVLVSMLTRTNRFKAYKQRRGMSIVHDWFDWLGGLPFEVANVTEIHRFLYVRGFRLENIWTTNGRGNNQFVFVRMADDPN